MHEYEEVIIRVRFFMQLLLKDIRIVGFFRPIIDPTPKGTRDHDIDLVLSNFNIGLQYEETYAYTLEEAKQMLNSGRQTEMMETILNKFKALEEKSSFVLCEGTDFAADSEAFEFDINAGIIADLGCPALVISNGYEKDAEQVITSCQLAVESLCQKGVDLLTGMDTYTAIKAVDQIYGRISPDDPQRIALALGFFEANVDAGSLRQRLAARKSVRITPQMFEYSLIEKAKKNRQHIVLPEGNSDRVLKAADIILRRSFCDITILGRHEAVERRVREYAQSYFELRKHKGVTLDMARDTMADPSYFGTMMVHKGSVDGMVSGSVNTTAHTILPAFQIIKTLPGSSIVSSVLLMCLKDRVLVFGDCAVNPNPTASQLAEIAVTSAGTASIFGIEPRVAMLSYSTGSSGTGADVEKVIQAMAMAKLPDSQVAGRATVFIFPDLNTGNNTYKAVQRASEKAVAIGPILQGMKRPINDLSRGCTIPDIVNTVAITAIQAQAGKNEI